MQALRTLLIVTLGLGASAVQLEHAVAQGLLLAGGQLVQPAQRPAFNVNHGPPMQNAQAHAIQTMYGGVPMLTNILRNQIVQTAKAAVVGAGALVDLSMSGDDDITMFDDTEYPPAEAGVGSTAMVGAAAAALALLNLQQVRHARA